MGQVQELKISQIMVESMFKAAMGDIERFNRKFMILSKVQVILTRFLLLYFRCKPFSSGKRQRLCTKIWVIAQFVR